jgi:hypothetical protein
MADWASLGLGVAVHLAHDPACLQLRRAEIQSGREYVGQPLEQINLIGRTCAGLPTSLAVTR